MATVFSKIGKWALTIGGAAISVLSGGALAGVGIPLMVAGQAIDTGTGSMDKVANAGDVLAQTLQGVKGMQAGAAAPGATIGFTQFIDFVKANLLIILLAIAGIFIIPKLLRGRR
jgi:hypothetical protein